MNITVQHTDRYYGEYVGPETVEGYRDPENYEPSKLDVQFVVIHCTLGFEAGDKHILSGKSDRKVSAHYYITKAGEVIEYVDPHVVAWHAGGSRWKYAGKSWSGFNHFSIGIELENRYVEDPKHGSTEYTEIQMQRLYELHRHLQSRFPVLKFPDRTVGHEDISGYRGKKDPGPMFDWHRFRLEVFEDVERNPPPLSVMVNGEILKQQLLLVEGRSYLPLRAVSEALGLEVKWFGDKKRVELRSKD